MGCTACRDDDDGVGGGRVDAFEGSLGAALRFFLPALDDGLYPQVAPFAKQRAHTGLVLLHLTFATKQLSQDSLNLTVGVTAGVFVCSIALIADSNRHYRFPAAAKIVNSNN